MQDEIISVIIPVYNVEKYVGRCLDSVIHQTYHDLQIIIVDDGCKDSSVTICETYAQSDERIQIVHKANGGLSSARNEGLKYANGRYCYFLDSDDYIEADALEKLVSAVQLENADLAVFGVDHFGEKGSRWSADPLQAGVYQIADTKSRIWFYAHIYYNYKIRFEVWNKLFDLNIIKHNHIRFENNYQVFAEDVCFLSYYLQFTKKVVVMSEVLHHYLIRSDSIMSQVENASKITNFVLLITKVNQFLTDNKMDQEMIEGYRILALQIMHDRFKWKSLREVSEEVSGLIDTSQGAYLKEACVYILNNRQKVLELYKNIESDRPLGKYIIEEAEICLSSAQSFKLNFVLLRIMILRFLRKVLK